MTMKVLRVFWPYVLCVAVVLVVVFAFASCTTTKFVEVEKVVKDTTYITKQQRDSVWLHDSVFVALTGDTVRIEKWHTKFVERLRTDTVYRQRVDSVPVPYAVEVEVEKKLSWLERLMMFLGSVTSGALLVLVVYGCWRIRDKLLFWK